MYNRDLLFSEIFGEKKNSMLFEMDQSTNFAAVLHMTFSKTTGKSLERLLKFHEPRPPFFFHQKGLYETFVASFVHPEKYHRRSNKTHTLMADIIIKRILDKIYFGLIYTF